MYHILYSNFKAAAIGFYNYHSLCNVLCCIVICHFIYITG